MTSASDIIKKILDDLNVESNPGSEDDSIVFKLDDMCDVEVYKHPYVDGYGIITKCGFNKSRVRSKASFIESMGLSIHKDKLGLSGMSTTRALNAAEISVSTEIKNKPSDYVDGKFYIRCSGMGECSVEKESRKSR